MMAKWIATPHTLRGILVGNCKAFPTMHRSYSKEHLKKSYRLLKTGKEPFILRAISP
jgi:hypothetical protein